jgi:glycosyltransferase involved in cell wall biosynthesis
MTSIEPRVSVVTAAYNAETTIGRAMKSVDAQTVDQRQVEHIIVDDGSTDATVEVVNRHARKYTRVLRTPHTGASESMNMGLRAARGEFLLLLDADDRLRPSMIAEMLNTFEEHPHAGYITCDYVEYATDGSVAIVEVDPQSVGDLLTNGVMHRRDLMHAFGLFDLSMHFSEYTLYLQYESRGVDRVHIDKPLFEYHRREGSQTADRAWVKRGVRQLRQRFGKDVVIREYS